jgi:hypothetical protein
VHTPVVVEVGSGVAEVSGIDLDRRVAEFFGELHRRGVQAVFDEL